MTKSTTLGQYMFWLRNAGGSCQSGIAADPEVGMVPITKLVSPDGKGYVLYHGDNQADILPRTVVDNFDRRLGVISPFK